MKKWLTNHSTTVTLAVLIAVVGVLAIALGVGALGAGVLGAGALVAGVGVSRAPTPPVVGLALMALLGCLVVAITLHLRRDGVARGKKPPVATFSSPLEGATIDLPTHQPLQGTFSVPVKGTVWAVQRAVGESAYHAFPQACEVDGLDWDCGKGYIGQASDHRRAFVIRLVQVSTEEAHQRLLLSGHSRGKVGLNDLSGLRTLGRVGVLRR